MTYKAMHIMYNNHYGDVKGMLQMIALSFLQLLIITGTDQGYVQSVPNISNQLIE